MKLELLNSHLAYVSIGSSKTHARRIESTYTFCGRSINPYAQPQSVREIDTVDLCGRCYRTLRTFDNGVKVRQP